MATTSLHTVEQKDEGLDLFSDLSDAFNPLVHWLDGSKPSHPCFDDWSRMHTIITTIKQEILSYALEACNKILTSPPLAAGSRIDSFRMSLDTNPGLWEAVLSAQHYQVLYFASRCEAREKYLPLIHAHPSEADAIDKFLRTDGVSTRAINYAVHAYITLSGVRVAHATSFVPPNAISAIGERHVVVREVDFERASESAMAETTPLWDLHDLAHLSVATLCMPLFGNKYQTHLSLLPKNLTALVRSPGMRSGKGPKFSDGMIFSELLTPMFEEELKQQSTAHTYTSLTTKLASGLAEYLLGRRKLKHHSSGAIIGPDAPITPVQLAVLAQNKRYELSASEIEQRVFTRGGPICSKSDVLLPMSARERLEFLAKSRSWMHFEVRNTIKHRAHKQAYVLVCEELMQSAEANSGKDVKLLQNIKRSLLYLDWKEDELLNLWDVVAVS
jgi:hypothetical protein